jgi:hypothetical protein
MLNTLLLVDPERNRYCRCELRLLSINLKESLVLIKI